MHKELKDKHFIKKPIFPGGSKAMKALITKELKYPIEALEAKIEGTVYLRYNIDFKGNVFSSKILSGIGYGCDEEAQRIVSKFHFIVPKGPRKLKLKFHKTIKIHFRLPKEQPKKEDKSTPQNQTPRKITYTIKPTQKKSKTPDPIKKSNGYTYTINF